METTKGSRPAVTYSTRRYQELSRPTNGGYGASARNLKAET